MKGTRSPFRFGAWLIDPSTNSIEGEQGRRQMEPRTMDVLLALCNAHGAVVSADELLQQCWGNIVNSDSSLHKNVAQLRRLLGDDAKSPEYIETIRMRGYRAVAPIDFESHGTRNWQAGSPFRGLMAFDEAHADVFFGRDEATRNLVETVTEQARHGFALTMVLGPSGVGKTSLVQAGLFPALSARGPDCEVAVLDSTAFDLVELGEQTLFTGLAGSLIDLQCGEQCAFPGESAISLGIRLQQSCASVIAVMEAALDSYAPSRSGLRFAVFIDRFEAFFNDGRIAETERQAFLRTLEQLARSRAALLVIACRNDFYPSIAKYPLLTEGKRHGGHFDLGAPGFSDIAQIIRRPAAAAGLSFDTDPATDARLDDVLCESATDSPDALPLLQYCLQELYRLRTEQGVLSFEAFHQLGDLEGAIGQRAEQVVLELSDAQRATIPHIMSLLIVLSLDGDTATSQRAPWSALRGVAAHEAVQALVEARLFVSDLADGNPVFGIAHDAILRRWPRMTDWIAAHRVALRTRGRLAQQATRWRDEGRPADLLLPRGKLLDEARELQHAGVLSLSDNESELIRASHQRARQRDRLQILALSAIITLALLATGLGLSAVAAKRSAEQRRNEAESMMDFMLGDFADKLRPLGRLDLLESVSGKAMQFLRGSDDDDLSATALTLRAKGLQVIGEVARSRGDSKVAIDALNQANAILTRRHQAAPTDIQVLKSLGANAYWVGQMHKDRNDWEAAGAAWRDYLAYSDRLHSLEPENDEWLIEQSYAHNNLGSLAFQRGMPELAVPEFQHSIGLKQRVLASKPDARSVKSDLASSYSWLASAKEALGELQEAQQLYAQEMQLILELRKQFPDESTLARRHALALQHRATLGVALGLDAIALRDYDEAKLLYIQLTSHDPENRAWQVEMAGLDVDRLRIIARHSPPADLLPRTRDVHRRLQTILAFDPMNSDWKLREAGARTQVAAAMRANGEVQAAEQEVNGAVASLEPFYKSNLSNLNGRLVLIEALQLQAVLQLQAKNASAAAQVCRKIHALIESDAGRSMNYQILDPWVRVNACLQNQEVFTKGAKLLSQIGYRDSSYFQFISSH
ncbi:winged helix-turn-helix domain-containing protein [Pseudoduganella sp. R-43]|uniref:nSTAND1 domain-containing NTPase n=1 Tax=unclassified Pseudoduganella TaxID=2637179 RepID=UPI003CF0FD38